MTPRERALRSLNHKEPDRVPIDVGGSHDSTFLEESYQGIQNFLKTNDRGKTANPWLGSIFPGEETYKKLGTDFRPVFLPVPEYKITTHSNGNLSFYDGNNSISAYTMFRINLNSKEWEKVEVAPVS